MSDVGDAPSLALRLRARIPYYAMVGALVASYGTLLGYMGRFLYPARGRRTSWVYVGQVQSWPDGETRLYKAPSGETVNVTRRSANGSAQDFDALSSVCPHLGCQVHWEPLKTRYFCPCHNGAFAPDGRAISGPPADAGQDLSAYPLKVESGLLYIEVPTEKLQLASEVRGRRGDVLVRLEPRGAGHDPCLRSSYGEGGSVGRG